ncbi:hypothetical protein VCR15J2_60085 [Vibrio coralliirubri]|nr:hypothetical protein VCR15J2_60085 [Vibrio coralliirubri]
MLFSGADSTVCSLNSLIFSFLFSNLLTLLTYFTSGSSSTLVTNRRTAGATRAKINSADGTICETAFNHASKNTPCSGSVFATMMAGMLRSIVGKTIETISGYWNLRENFFMIDSLMPDFDWLTDGVILAPPITIKNRQH